MTRRTERLMLFCGVWFFVFACTDSTDAFLENNLNGNGADGDADTDVDSEPDADTDSDTVAGSRCSPECEESEFCRLEACDDTRGTCTPVPEEISSTIDSVCGCDGVTYYNEASAYQHGVSVDYTGGCIHNETPEYHQVLGQGTLIASGTVRRDMTQFTWNEDFLPVPEAHVTMYVFSYTFNLADGPEPLLIEQDFPFQGLPFSFEIRGDLELPPENGINLRVDIFNHAGAVVAVGDLGNEGRNEAVPGTENMKITVSGLEPCDSPDAGGFCGGYSL